MPKRKVYEHNEEKDKLDMAFAELFGWSELECTDLGSIVGINPVTKRLDNIPSPTRSKSDLTKTLDMIRKQFNVCPVPENAQCVHIIGSWAPEDILNGLLAVIK